MWLSYVTAALLMIPLAIMTFGGYIGGDWHSHNVHTTFTGPWGGVKLALVYMFILAWSTYGTEVTASFAPEYKDTQRDTHRALRSAAMFMLLLCILLVFAALLARAGWIATVRASALSQMAQIQTKATVVLPAGRGTIFDI